LAAYIIKDLRLLMVGKVDILNKRIIEERHKRASRSEGAAAAAVSSDLIDLSHVIENGVTTYKGLPAPVICDHISHRPLCHFLCCSSKSLRTGKPFLLANLLPNPFVAMLFAVACASVFLACARGRRRSAYWRLYWQRSYLAQCSLSLPSESLGRAWRGGSQ
jgi:hypothetical protein